MKGNMVTLYEQLDGKYNFGVRSEDDLPKGTLEFVRDMAKITEVQLTKVELNSPEIESLFVQFNRCPLAKARKYAKLVAAYTESDYEEFISNKTQGESLI